MSAGTTDSLIEGAHLFDQASEYALAGLALVTDADLDLATPCADWNLRMLLRHLADVADALTVLVATGVLELRSREPNGNDLAFAIQQTETLVEALRHVREASDRSSPAVRDGWARTAAGLGAVELAAHGWDVFATIGRPRPIPDALADALIAATTATITDDARGTNFAAAVTLADSAPSSDRFLAFLGRPPAV